MNHVFRVLGVALMLAAAGCQPAGQVVGGQVKLAPTDSAAFLDRIASQASVTESDAVTGILLMLERQEETTFADAVAKLADDRIISPSWNLQADRAITKGKLAYMVYQACRLKGGLTLSVCGPSQRYCLKDLQYRGLMTPGVPYNAVTGLEYVAVLSRADELRQTGKVSGVMSPGEGVR